MMEEPGACSKLESQVAVASASHVALQANGQAATSHVAGAWSKLQWNGLSRFRHHSNACIKREMWQSDLQGP